MNRSSKPVYLEKGFLGFSTNVTPLLVTVGLRHEIDHFRTPKEWVAISSLHLIVKGAGSGFAEHRICF